MSVQRDSEDFLVSVGIQTSRTNTPLPPITDDNSNSFGTLNIEGNPNDVIDRLPKTTTNVTSTWKNSDASKSNQFPSKPTKLTNRSKVPSKNKSLLGLNTDASSGSAVTARSTTSKTNSRSNFSGKQSVTYMSSARVPATRFNSPEPDNCDFEPYKIINNTNKFKNDKPDYENSVSVSSNLEIVSTRSSEMSATRRIPSGSAVPIIKMKQDAVLTRGNRKLHGIAELNSMRNKHISFDQFRLSKRKGSPTKERNDFRLAKQLSFGEDDDGNTSKRPLSIMGRGPNSDCSNYGLKSGDSVSRISPQLAIARSKTYSGPLFKGSAHSSTTNNNNNKGVTIDDDSKDEMNLYEIKGNSLKRETTAVANSAILNRNTPQGNGEQVLTGIHGDGDDKTRSPPLAKYMNVLPSPSGASDSKLMEPFLLSVDQSNGTNTGIKSVPKRFKPKRDSSSKVVLKYYADRPMKKQMQEGSNFNKNNLQNVEGMMQSQSMKTGIQVDPVDKKVSFEPDDNSLAVASAVAITNSGFLDNQSVVTTGGPVSLTMHNLEIFDQLSSTQASSSIKLQSSLNQSEDEDLLNDRVIGWIKERQKAVKSGGSSKNFDAQEQQQVKDLKETQLFSSSMVYKNPLPVIHY